jgi:two-component system, response regulator PdtaR
VSSQDRTGPTIVVAEDALQLREALADMLWSHGFDVVGQAGTGTEAVALAESLRPDLVLIDYRMPEMNGVAATDAIKTTRPRTQVVMFTAFDEASLSADATRVGASSFLVKGCAPTVILEALNRALRHETAAETPA